MSGQSFLKALERSQIGVIFPPFFSVRDFLMTAETIQSKKQKKQFSFDSFLEISIMCRMFVILERRGCMFT